jgi:3-hydroxyacyl-CoA dehydrogenase
MHFADTVGLAAVYVKVCEFRDRFGAEFWEPPALLKDLASKNQRFADFDKSNK